VKSTHAAGAAIALAAITLLAGLSALQLDPEVDFVDTVPAHPGLPLYRAALADLDGFRFVVIHMPHDSTSGTASLR
jgi:hypothetical protein